MRSEINMENTLNRLLGSLAQIPKDEVGEGWCKMR